MSISNNNGERSRKVFFSRSNSGSSTAATVVSIIIALTLLASGFALISPTTPLTTTAFAQEENNATTTITINGDADSDTDGSVDGAGGGGENGNITSSTNTTAASSSSLGIELSSQPVYQEHLRVVGQNPINETHMSVTFSGNGTLTLPNNTTQTINTTGNGSALISFMTLSVQGKETIRTQDGSDTANATFYEIDQQPAATGESKGIVIAVVNTNSTSGMLAPFNGMILAGIDDIQTTTGESHITLWRWESGIGSNSSGVAPPVQ
jgi:hypothetical protein